MKFIVGGLLIIAAVVYLVISSTQASAQYFLTVKEVNAKGQSIVGRNMRISAPCSATASNMMPNRSP
jgi:cytochrome c-type biogenesis protein CcmE